MSPLAQINELPLWKVYLLMRYAEDAEMQVRSTPKRRAEIQRDVNRLFGK